MTISATTNRVTYTGNGATTAFAFAYPFHAEADLVVIETIIATGAQTTKSLTTHYTISGTTDAQGHYPNGGTVNAVTAPASTVTWTIYRDPSPVQNTDFVQNDDLPAESLESAIDYQTLLNQRTRDLITRSLRQPEGDSANIDYLPAKVTRASKYLAFDADGDPVASSGTTSDLVATPFIETLLDDANAAAARATLGFPTVSGATTGHALIVDPAASGGMSWNHRVQPNPIINGRMNVWQRGTTFTAATTPANNDDTYLADRWYLLADGNDIVDVTRESSVVPTNGQYALAMDVETTNKKFGIAQIIERANCHGFLGQTVTLSFKAKVSTTTNLDNVKAAIIAWSGTADTVTSDIISAWGIEGTNPTLIANATYENTPANLSVTTDYATYSVSGAIDTASAANIILFIWSDVTTTALGEFLYVTDVKLELGAVATPIQFVPFEEELARCQRYYQKSFQYATSPASNAGLLGASTFTAASAGTASLFGMYVSLIPMRTDPTVTLYNPSASGSDMRNYSQNETLSVTSAPAANKSFRGFQVQAIGSAGTLVGQGLAIHWTADAEL